MNNIYKNNSNFDKYVFTKNKEKFIEHNKEYQNNINSVIHFINLEELQLHLKKLKNF